VADRLTLVPARRFRAVVTCTTCRTVVVVGPETDNGDCVPFCLPVEMWPSGQTGPRHMGKCAGGVLQVTVEEVEVVR